MGKKTTPLRLTLPMRGVHHRAVSNVPKIHVLSKCPCGLVYVGKFQRMIETRILKHEASKLSPHWSFLPTGCRRVEAEICLFFFVFLCFYGWKSKVYKDKMFLLTHFFINLQLFHFFLSLRRNFKVWANLYHTNS